MGEWVVRSDQQIWGQVGGWANLGYCLHRRHTHTHFGRMSQRMCVICARRSFPLRPHACIHAYVGAHAGALCNHACYDGLPRRRRPRVAEADTHWYTNIVCHIRALVPNIQKITCALACVLCAYVHSCVHACVRACMRACVRVYVCVCA